MPFSTYLLIFDDSRLERHFDFFLFNFLLQGFFGDLSEFAQFLLVELIEEFAVVEPAARPRVREHRVISGHALVLLHEVLVELLEVPLLYAASAAVMYSASFSSR